MTQPRSLLRLSLSWENPLSHPIPGRQTSPSPLFSLRKAYYPSFWKFSRKFGHELLYPLELRTQVNKQLENGLIKCHQGVNTSCLIYVRERRKSGKSSQKVTLQLSHKGPTEPLGHRGGRGKEDGEFYKEEISVWHAWSMEMTVSLTHSTAGAGSS